LTAVGLALRAVGLGARGLWLDEAITVRHANRPLIDVLSRLASGVHPPLYHVLMHYWISAFGLGEVALRSFSVLIGVLAIPTAFWAGSRVYDRRTGIVAAGLVAFSPFLIWYSQEARMYGLLFLAALLSTAFLILALRENRPRLWWGYFASALVGLFTHYFFLFLFAGHVAYYLLGDLPRTERLRRLEGSAKASVRRPWRLFADVATLGPWLAANVALVATLAVWLGNSVFVRVAGEQNALLSSVAGSGLGYGQEAPHLAVRFNDVVLVVAQMLTGFHSAKAMGAMVALWPLVIYAVMLLIRFVKPVTARTQLLVVSSAGILVMMAVGQWQGQILAVRYFIAVAAPAILLGARVLTKLGRRERTAVVAVVLALSVGAWTDQSFDPRNDMRYDNRTALQTVVRQRRIDDAVLYVPFYLDPLTSYYLPAGVKAAGIPQQNERGELRGSRNQIGQDLDRLVGPSRRVWLVLSFQNIGQLQSDAFVVRRWLDEAGYRLALDERMNQVELLRYDNPNRPQLFLESSVPSSSATSSVGGGAK